MAHSAVRILPGHIARGAQLLGYVVFALWAVLVALLGRTATHIWLEAETKRASLALAVSEVQVMPPFIGADLSAEKGESAIKSIGEKKIFGELGRVAAPAQPTPTISRAPMALKLVGTYVSPRPRESYAIIEHTQRGEQDVFGVQDSIFDDARLVSVGVDKVMVERDGEQKELTLIEGSSDSGGGDTEGGSRVIVAESDVDEALSNLPVLLTQVRAVPYFKNGQAVGLRLFAIKSGSLFEKIGLQNGDVLQSINGNQLGDFSQALKLFERLKAERALKVVLERNRTPMTFNYEIR